MVSQYLCENGFVPTPTENHKKNMIRATARLLPSKGLAGLSLVEVARITGAPRGSLYHYFPGGWEELVRDALSVAQDYGLNLVQALPVSDDKPEAVVQAMGREFKRWMKKTGFDGGCPVAAAALSAGEDEPAIRSQCADIYARWIAALDARFQAHGLKKPDSGRFAQAVLDGFEGALIRARAQKNVTPIDTAVANLTVLAQVLYLRR